MNRQDVYIVDAVRTPMGRAHGRLSAFSVAQLSENILAALKKRNALSSSGVDEVIIGNAVSAGAGQNFVRKALIDAGFAVTTPGHSVGNVCASGLQAVFNGFYRIRAGEADMVIAAGAESVSHMPELIFKKDYEIKKMKGLTESLKHDGLWCSVSNRLMGSLCEDMARQQRVTKKEQDDYAFNSYRKAAQGWD